MRGEAILANLLVCVVLTPLTRRLDPRAQVDETAPADYDDLPPVATGPLQARS